MKSLFAPQFRYAVSKLDAKLAPKQTYLIWALAKNLNGSEAVDVCRMFFFIFAVALFGLKAPASDLGQCLYAANFNEHRLEKENSVRLCFDKYKSLISKESCYSYLDKKVAKLSSTNLSEDIKGLCFYDTTPAKDLNACATETKKFKVAANHDEALFYCYQQFQENISQKDCLKISGQMIYPSKKNYLKEHCLNFVN